jgi:general secretion pathway protein G
MLLRQNRHNKRAAFTLMEIIAVVTIIMILAGVGVLGFNTVIAQQREKRAIMDCETITKAAMIYQSQHGVYPASLEALASQQPDGSPPLMPAALLEDPWHQRYMYDPGTVNSMGEPRVYANGPNGKVLSNWKQ